MRRTPWMTMMKVSDLFDVSYGHSLELNRLTIARTDGINFVSRTSQNNGVSARVKRIPDIEPAKAGLITVAVSGNPMECFLQPEPFYTAFHVFLLEPKIPMTDLQKLYYCECLKANKYRYNYGRQANRTLKDILIPSPDDIPDWINEIDLNCFSNANQPVTQTPTPSLNTSDWVEYRFDELFDIKKGKRLTKANMLPGKLPFIGSIDKNNGVSAYVGQPAIHDGNTITVNYNGSVAEAFYQPEPYWACDDCNVLYPKFKLNPYIALFLTTIIRNEKYRFNYGRKWHVERMKNSVIKLPAKSDGTPDWEFMENYIKSLPFSSQI